MVIKGREKMKSREKRIYIIAFLLSIVFGIIGMLMIQSNMGRLSITGFSGYCMFFSSLTVIAVLIAMIISIKLERK